MLFIADSLLLASVLTDKFKNLPTIFLGLIINSFNHAYIMCLYYLYVNYSIVNLREGLEGLQTSKVHMTSEGTISIKYAM